MSQKLSRLFTLLSSLEHHQLELEIMKKENINIVKDYLKNQNLNLSSKKILTSLLFCSDEKIAIIENENSLSSTLKETSKQLVRSIITESDSKDLLTNYQRIFDDWQVKDIANNEKIAQRIEEQVSQIMNKAFWDKIYQDLSERKNESVMVLLKDLREKVKGLCMKEEMKNQIDRQFDIDIIKQIIDNDEMEIRDFEMFFQPLMQTILSLQSPGNDQALLEAQNKVKKQLSEDWKLAFISSLKVLNEAVAEIYKDMIKIIHT